MTRPIAALLTLAVVLSTTDANAQKFRRSGRVISFQPASSAPVSPLPFPAVTQAPIAPLAQPAQIVTPTAAPSMIYSDRVTQQPAPSRVYSYSYYASPYPARTYVAYGADDFPFYGVPYGHPYDPWTWPYMSGSYNRGLARYYDPPVK